VRILVVNPNTTASMTTAIGETCRAVAAADTEVTAINPAWGPPSIETFVEEHVAAAAMLQTIAEHRDSVPGGAPVHDRDRDRQRRPNVRRHGRCRRHVPRCASIRATSLSVLEVEQDLARAERVLAEESRRAVDEDGAEAIVLGCAGMGPPEHPGELVADHPHPAFAQGSATWASPGRGGQDAVVRTRWSGRGGQDAAIMVRSRKNRWAGPAGQRGGALRRAGGQVPGDALDITQGLDAPWLPPESLCAAILSRLFPDAPPGDPVAVLLWSTGRGALNGRPRRMSWTYQAAVAD